MSYSRYPHINRVIHRYRYSGLTRERTGGKILTGWSQKSVFLASGYKNELHLKWTQLSKFFKMESDVVFECKYWGVSMTGSPPIFLFKPTSNNKTGRVTLR